MFKKNGLLVLVAVLLVVGLLSIPSCTSNQDEVNPSEPPVPEPAEKIHPKLDSHLEALIRAEERGELEEYASRRDIELIDGSVTVIIECEPGQAETVAEAAGALGNVELSVRDLVQALVPITKLTALADIPGVRRVRLPIYPVEND